MIMMVVMMLMMDDQYDDDDKDDDDDMLTYLFLEVREHCLEPVGICITLIAVSKE